MIEKNPAPQDHKTRCAWVRSGNQLYYEYHDREWGVPVHDDSRHFEFLMLEGAQAGLSWSTVLNKRENYRRAFDGFDPLKVSRFSEKKIEQLMQDASIIRNRLKIVSAIGNAQAFLEIVKEFDTFDSYIWGFVGGAPIQGTQVDSVTSPESDALSKNLKKRGFKFVGSIIMYSHMQAVGMINDHSQDCFRREYCATLR